VDDQSFNIEALKVILKYKVGIDTDLFCDSAGDGLDALKKIITDVEDKHSG
jgi:hypothetical protein